MNIVRVKINFGNEYEETDRSVVVLWTSDGSTFVTILRCRSNDDEGSGNDTVGCDPDGFVKGRWESEGVVEEAKGDGFDKVGCGHVSFRSSDATERKRDHNCSWCWPSGENIDGADVFIVVNGLKADVNGFGDEVIGRI